MADEVGALRVLVLEPLVLLASVFFRRGSCWGCLESKRGGEALHGVWASCVEGRCPTQFPAPHTMGWAFDADLWRAVGRASGLEARALYRWNEAHAPEDCSRSLEGCLGLTFYTPNVNLARDPRWGRIEEVPGEDPYHNGAYLSLIHI